MIKNLLKSRIMIKIQNLMGSATLMVTDTARC